MNIAFFCEGFTKASIVALPWRQIQEIASRILAQGSLTCVLTDLSPGLPKDEQINGMSIHRIRKKGSLLDLRDLLESLSENDVDLVNWNSGPLSALYFLRLRKLLSKRIVWTIYQGKIFRQDLTSLRLSDILRLRRFWNSILCSFTPSFVIKKGADIHQVKRIITLSKRLKSYLEGMRIDGEKITSIPSGVDTKNIRPLSQEDKTNKKVTFGFEEKDKIILYFGPLSTPRGADIVISAMKRILEEIPTAKLVILARKSGQDLTETNLENLARKNSTIQLIGGITQPKMIMQYLGMADVVALPFRFWPYTECPLTVLESMAMEKPVVTTYAGSLSEIVENGRTGFLVPPANVISYSQAIVKILNDEQLSSEMGKRAREYVEKFHDWDIIAKSTFNVFQKAMNEDI